MLYQIEETEVCGFVFDDLERRRWTRHDRGRSRSVAEEEAASGGDDADGRPPLSVAATEAVVLVHHGDDVADAQRLETQREVLVETGVRAHQVCVGVLRRHSRARADGF